MQITFFGIYAFLLNKQNITFREGEIFPFPILSSFGWSNN